MYNVDRAGDNVTSVEEYDVVLNGETVSAKTLVGTMHYSFDSNGKQFRKKYVSADGAEQKYVFEYQDEQNVAVQLPTGVVSHAKSDHLGRKVFDELQLKTGIVNRKFAYYDGVITDAHKANDKRTSEATTHLVKQIEFADGHILEYEYDNEERITKVWDHADQSVTTYEYDALGQLLKETVNGVVVNEMTYDQYGNILTKNGVAYEYGDTNWKDKLTKIGSQSISYDSNGNPLTYRGNRLYWEKGRQLKQFGGVTYKYNNDGIRIEKTENNKLHTYKLDGTNIVKETVACICGSNCNNYVCEYLYDLDGTVCGIKYNGDAYYFYKNLQGDIIAITNETGATIARYSYDAWGKVLSVTDAYGNSITDQTHVANVNPFRYRSYYYDTETKLYYLQSRYYTPEDGRFINADIIEVSINFPVVANLNLFSYCSNNPINNADLTGLFTETLTLGSYLIATLSNALVKVVLGVNASIASLKAAIASSWLTVLCIAAVAVAIVGVVYTVSTVKSLMADAQKTKDAVKEKVRKNGVDPNKIRNNTVYVIVYKNTIDVVYAGRTCNYPKRYYSHTHGRYPTNTYTMLPIATGLTYKESRALEQTIICAYLIKNLDNLINSISPRKWGNFLKEFNTMQSLIAAQFDPE